MAEPATPGTRLRPGATTWRDALLLAPALAPLVLLPFGIAAELGILLAAALGLVALGRGRIDLRAPGFGLATVLFVAYWLPEVVSAPDAVAPRKSWTEVAADLRFLPFLWFVAHALRAEARFLLALRGVALLLALWCADALLQAGTGWSLGGANRADRLSGIFGDDNLKLGGVVAVLAPFGLLAAWRRWGVRGAALAFAPLLLVVLLAGARAAWIMLFVGTALVLGREWGARRGALALGALLAIAVGAGAAAAALSPRFAERVDRTVAALAGGEHGLDHALAGRLPIFRTALAMSLAHPVNGVGVRGFRHAYPYFAAPDDPWVDPRTGQGAAHAHQIVLELGSETGAFGLLCWGLGLGLAWRAWRAAPAAARTRAAAPGCALAVMLFPLNTHYAFYSSFWSLLLFVMLALWLAGLHARAAPDRSDH